MSTMSSWLSRRAMRGCGGGGSGLLVVVVVVNS